jgi:AcrR family transcriptional regulator
MPLAGQRQIGVVIKNESYHSIDVMMPNPTADDTRTRILIEAERLFRHFGYAKTTVADIADACRMSSANVYRFFASKSQINEAICDRIMSDFEGQLRQIATAHASAAERLTRFIELSARFIAETSVQEKKVHDMFVVAMEEQWASIQRHLQASTQMIADIVASGIAAGEFRLQDPLRAAKCIHSCLAGLKHPVVVAQCRNEPDMASPAEMAAFILSALKA